MVHVLVIGAAGMVGRKLVERLAVEQGALGREVGRLSLVDIVYGSLGEILSLGPAPYVSDEQLSEAVAKLSRLVTGV